MPSELLFLEYPYWKIDLTLSVEIMGNQFNSSASMQFKINQKPVNGTCYVDKFEGFAMSTLFNITCQDWVDEDGIVIKYEYFGINYVAIF
jgi:hypothetical protein